MRSAATIPSTGETRPRTSSGEICAPLAASRSRLFPIAARPRSTAPGAASWSETRRPDAASTWAMPPPIWPAPTTRTCSKFTGDSLRAAVLLARALVHLGADEEDRRRDEDVGREHEEHGQAPRRALEVRHLGHPAAEERGGHEPRGDHEERTAARPAHLRLLGRRVAEEERDRGPEEEQCDGPADDAERGVEGAVRHG